MDGPKDYHIKWSQTQKDKYHDIVYYVEAKKMIEINFTEYRLTDFEKLMKVGEG